MNDRDAQIKSLHQVLERKPEHERALVDLAEAYEFNGNLDKAEEYALMARKVNPENLSHAELLKRIRNKREGGG